MNWCHQTKEKEETEEKIIGKKSSLTLTLWFERIVEITLKAKAKSIRTQNTITCFKQYFLYSALHIVIHQEGATTSLPSIFVSATWSDS